MDNINKVENYTIKQNWLMLSTKPMPILDENHNIRGYVKKFYKSLGEMAFAYLSCRPLFNNFETEDSNGNIHIRVIQSVLFFKKAEWQVELYCDQQKKTTFILRDISSSLAAKTLAFEFEGRKITLENNRVRYQTRFINNKRLTINYGIKNINSIPDEYVMACELVPDALREIDGTIDLITIYLQMY